MTSPMLIGVSGGSASGKTEIARATARAAKPLTALVLSEDDYYGDHGARADFDAALFNFDHPDSRDHALMAEQLAALKRGETVAAPVYDYTIHRRRSDTRALPPADIIIAEGIHLFADAKLRSLFDLTVYVDAPDDVRLARRALRDINERGRTPQSVIQQYLRTVRPMHMAWTLPGREVADLVIENDKAAARPPHDLEDFFTELATPVRDAITQFHANKASAR